MNPWKRRFLLETIIFRCELFVLGRVYRISEPTLPWLPVWINMKSLHRRLGSAVLQVVMYGRIGDDPSFVDWGVGHEGRVEMGFCSWYFWVEKSFFLMAWEYIFFVLYRCVYVFFLVWIWYVILICIFRCIYTRDQCMILFWFVEYIELLSRLQETLGKLRGGSPWKKASPLS